MSEVQKTLNYIINHTKTEILELQEKLKSKKVLIVPLAQKMGGKSYYLQFFTKALGEEHFEHISMGDIMRGIKKDLAIEENKKNIETSLSKKFRNAQEIIETIQNSTSGTLVPDEIAFFFLEKRLQEVDSTKSIILDGVPRSEEQIKYLEVLEKDLKMPVFICYFDAAYEVLDLRADSRRVCPNCHLDLNIISMPSAKVLYKNGEFVMLCDNCKDVEMTVKTGDESKDEIQKARLSYEKLLEKIHKDLGNKLVYIQTSLSVKEYLGPLEEVNKSFSFKVENGNVVKYQKPQIVKTKIGEVYALSPENVSSLLIKKLNKFI